MYLMWKSCWAGAAITKPQGRESSGVTDHTGEKSET